MSRSPYDREIARLSVPAFGALIAEPLYVGPCRRISLSGPNAAA